MLNVMTRSTYLGEIKVNLTVIKLSTRGVLSSHVWDQLTNVFTLCSVATQCYVLSPRVVDMYISYM